MFPIKIDKNVSDLLDKCILDKCVQENVTCKEFYFLLLFITKIIEKF